MTDDLRTAYEACANLERADIDNLIGLGVPALALAQPAVLVKSRVALLPGHRFEFATSGDHSALIIPAIEAGELVDFVAWHPRTKQLASWLGRAKCIGWDEIYAPNLSGEPIKIWADPLGWLRCERRGIIPIDVQMLAISLSLWAVTFRLSFARTRRTVEPSRLRFAACLPAYLSPKLKLLRLHESGLNRD